MTGPKGKKTKGLRWAQYGAAALFFGWVAFLCVSIANEPSEKAGADAPSKGSSSPAALRDAFRTAVQEQDAGRLQRLFTHDSVAEKYADNYFVQLKAANAHGLRPVVEKLDSDRYLVVRGRGNHGAVCTSWTLKVNNSRWYLDGTPPTTGALCSG
ncbi:hypothetical protein [Streptomyces sp. NPDC048650]|uniref:hypothetical protein n=1 Tax=unclassified Streptomyces TaxID=2593676 RepID=UPI0037105791